MSISISISIWSLTILRAPIYPSDLNHFNHFNRCYADIGKAGAIVFSIPYYFPIRRLFTNRICPCFPLSMFKDLNYIFTFFLFLSLWLSRPMSLCPTHSSIIYSRVLISWKFPGLPSRRTWRGLWTQNTRFSGWTNFTTKFENNIEFFPYSSRWICSCI